MAGRTDRGRGSQIPGRNYNFHANREATTRAEWRGPPKPQADDLKTAKAHEIYKRLGLLSDDAICSELGQDWEDVYEQRAREKQMRERLGLPETDTIEPPGETGDRLDDLDR
jgi:capsid protein